MHDFNYEFADYYLDIIIDPKPIILPEEKPEENGELDSFRYAISSIKEFSKHKKDEEISRFVEDHYSHEKCSFYIHSQEISVIQLIEKGVYHFKQQRKKLDKK